MSGPPPTGIVINPIWDQSVLSDPNVAQIESAISTEIRSLENTLVGSVTINLHIGWGEVGGSTIATDEAAAALVGSSMKLAYSAVAPAIDRLSSAIAASGHPIGTTDPESSGLIEVTQADAIVLGLAPNTPVDAYIGFSNALTWDYTHAQYGVAGAYDLAGVVDHEVTHVLGRVTLANAATPWLLDFYRYNTGGRDLFHHTSGDYFSVSGTQIGAEMFASSGDLSDWNDFTPSDAFGDAIAGTPQNMVGLDQTVMQGLGYQFFDVYNINYTVAAYFRAYAFQETYDQSWVARITANTATYGDLRAFLLSDPTIQAAFTAKILAEYQTYMGRQPTSDEIAVWENLVHNGVRQMDMQTTLVASTEGQARLSINISNLFLKDFGQSPSQGQLYFYSAKVEQGETLSNVDQELQSISTAQAYAQQQIVSDYNTYFGRDPTSAEISYWTEQKSLTGSLDLVPALVADPVGQANLTAQIKLLYDTYFGRDPTTSEYAVWQGLIVGGADFGTLRSTLVGSPDGQSHTTAEIHSLYDTYFGRDPTASEYTVWQGLVAGGTDFNGLRAALLTSSEGQTHTNAEIKSLYDTYFGRDPGVSEYSVWQGLIAGGADFNALRSTLVGSSDGQAHTTAEIKLLYDTYFGRDPSASEYSVWRGLIAGGTDFGGLRATLVGSPEGQAHTTVEIKSLYDTYFGRDPSGSEYSVWQGLIAGGTDFNGLRGTLVGSPEGQAHTTAEIKLLYDTYFGRDPGGSEYSVWQGLVANGADFGALRGTLLGSSEGQSHTTAEIKLLYDTYFGRDPAGSEYSVWQGLIAGGTDFHQLQDTLERQSTATSVQHLVGAGAAQTFALGAAPNLTIDAFNAQLATITLSSAQYGGINPLDAAHAQQIAAYDGTDVLITLDATHSILLEHTQLSALHAGDFVFG